MLATQFCFVFEAWSVEFPLSAPPVLLVTVKEIGARKREMQNLKAGSRLDRLIAALRSLEERGISFHGPYATSRGELIQVEDQILKATELIELFERGELTREGIRSFLAAQIPPESGQEIC